MSLSQKFQGKVLVPWYNSYEWKYIYEILYNRNEGEYFKALEILKIWKARAPLLSAGIEGTLIILDVLIQNKDSLSNDQMVQVFSISLLRFLNLTAGNNEKQGTFYQTVKRNDLPKWLIDIRHDIAHNNKLPSKSILEISLKQCLNWIVKKYWMVQNEIICDNIVTQSPDDVNVTELLGNYCELNISLYYKTDVSAHNEALFKKINYFVTKRHNKESTDLYGMLNILEEMLKQSMESVKCKNFAEDIANILASENALFVIADKDDFQDLEIIPQSFKQIWTNILNILIENGLLFSLVEKFHKITNALLINNNIKKLSSIWLREIFQGLLKYKVLNEHNIQYFDKIIMSLDMSIKDDNYLCLKCNSSNHFDSKLFENIVLGSANIYTLDFIVFLLHYNESCEDDINSIVYLVKSMVIKKFNSCEELLQSGYQVEEFIDKDLTMDVEEVRILEKVSGSSQKSNFRSKWIPVKNKSDFEGCPLGILPHQDRSKNPCLVLD